MGAVALPLIAIRVIHASTAQVAAIAAMASVASLLAAFPLGVYVDFRRKRMTMVAADIARFLSLFSIPILWSLSMLTYWHLCVMAIVNAVSQLAFSAASQANLRALVDDAQLVEANAQLQAVTWASLTIGPAIGGVLVGTVGEVNTLLFDSISFLFSAFAVLALHTPEPSLLPVKSKKSRMEIFGGLQFILRVHSLRLMLFNWLVFAGCVGMTTPIATVYFIRVLHLRAWQYGLLLGVPSLAGLLGARATGRAVAAFGLHRTLRRASILRGPWYFLIPLARPGPSGLFLCLLGESGLLFFSAMTNSAMTTLRQIETPNELTGRVAALWSFATTLAQPLSIFLGGAAASILSPRIVLTVAAAILSLSCIGLGQERPTQAPMPEEGMER